MERITIIGMGLVGTSLGLALKKGGSTSLELVGHDLDPGNSATAKKRGALDKTHHTLAGAVEGARMVVLATPVMAIREILEHLGPHLAPGTVVTDTGSTKVQVLAWAQEHLPPSVPFVGGHPMAGKEQPGPEAADANLFQGAVYAICPGSNANQQAVGSVVAMAEAVGAKPYFVNPAEHDSYVAAVSHLPFLLSISLVAVTAQSPAWREMSRLAANGYRDITRLASGDPIMHRDICLTNQEPLTHWIDQCIKQLYSFRQMLQNEPAGIEKAFIAAWEARTQWAAGIHGGQSRPGEELPRASETMTALFVGEKMARRMREISEKDKPDKTKYRKP